MPAKPPGKPPTRAPKNRPDKSGTQERLQKVLAAAGIASRRHCEELITAGRVEVDRQVVTKLGTRVDPTTQEIRVDGTPLKKQRHLYFAVNKPTGVVSTNSDPAGRIRVVDLVPDETRLFTIGRLDRSSEGLILVTNDGDLANRLSHPRYGIPKTYRIRVMGSPSRETLEKLRKGVHLAEGVTRVASLRVKGRHERGTDLEMILTEGRNREIRRIMARFGHKVLQLRRIAIGPIRLSQMSVGEWRRLSRDEVRQLQRFAKRHGSSAAPMRSKRADGPKRKTSARSQSRREADTRGTKPAKQIGVTRAKKNVTGTVLGYGDSGTTTRKPAKKKAVKEKSSRRDGTRSKTQGTKRSGSQKKTTRAKTTRAKTTRAKSTRAKTGKRGNRRS